MPIDCLPQFPVKETFHKQFDMMLRKCDSVVTMGDFNCRLGTNVHIVMKMLQDASEIP